METNKLNKSTLTDSPDLERFFEEATPESWRAAAEKLLKGKSFDKTLLTSTPEEILLQPLYSLWDDPGHELFNSYPGQKPFLRGKQASGQTRGWQIAQTVVAASPIAANKIILDGLKAGENAVSVNITSLQDDGAVQVREIGDLAALLQDVDLTVVPLFIQCDASSSSALAAALSAYFEGESLSENIGGQLVSDPISDYARNGILPRSLEDLLKEQHQLQAYKHKVLEGFQLIGVNTIDYHNAGASAVQELGIALSTAVAYLRNVLKAHSEIELKTLAADFCFSFACGSNFFMEIAKLRAARLLWTRILETFGDGDAADGMNIHCETSNWNKTLLDPHSNILRATTEAMSAVIGGCNSINIAPYNMLTGESSSFSRRLARNIHHILREESHFSRVIDPAGGSPYVEKLTAQLAEKAWSFFRELETEGGIIESLLSGKFQKRIASTADERLQRLRKVKDTLVGSNRYANPDEQLDKAAIVHPVVQSSNINSSFTNSGLSVVNQESFEQIRRAISGGITILGIANALGAAEKNEITALKMHRGAEIFEQLRRDVEKLKADNASGLKRIAFACMGSPSDYRLRAEFTENLLATAGLRGDRIMNPSAPLKPKPSLLERNDAVIVLCSSDTLYDEHAADYVAHLRGGGLQARILIAGRPRENESALRTAGVDGFIYSGCDVLAALQLAVQALEEKI